MKKTTAKLRKTRRRAFLRRVKLGHNANYDLSFADELLAVFAGVTLLIVTTTGWLEEYPQTIATIMGSIAIVSTLVLIAINQRDFILRMVFVGMAVIGAFCGAEAIMWVSANDLYPARLQIMALPAGVLVWALVREIAILILNMDKAIRD